MDSIVKKQQSVRQW